MRAACISILALLAACLPAGNSMAQTSQQRLDAWLHSLTSLQAEFFQQVLDAEGEVIQEARGIFELKKPGRFRWQYHAPYAQYILADGKNLWMLDPELDQASVQPLEQALGSAPIILLTGLTPLSKDFEISDMPPAFGLDWVALIPKIQDTEFYRVEIGLDGNLIREMKLHDHFDQQTIIRLEDIRTPAELPDTRFIFSVPEGVDVIGSPR